MWQDIQGVSRVGLHEPLAHGQGQLVAFERSLALPKTLTVDEEFARVLGIYLADGCVKTHKGSSRVVFCLGSEEKALFAEDATRFFAQVRFQALDRGPGDLCHAGVQPQSSRRGLPRALRRQA